MKTVGNLLRMVSTKKVLKLSSLTMSNRVVTGTYGIKGSETLIDLVDSTRVYGGSFGYKEAGKTFELKEFPDWDSIPEEYTIKIEY